MENNKNMEKQLSDEELEKLAAGTDTESLRMSGKHVPLPDARSKKECDGGYSGNTVPILPDV